MRHAVRLTGNALIGLCALGFVALGAALLVPESTPVTAPPISLPISVPWPAAPAPNPTNPNVASATTQLGVPGAAASAVQPGLPITHIDIPSIGLSADVVEASLVTVSGGVTWQVPAFKIGHAEGTANAGEPGNAVLLGHVTSLRAGNVFEDLQKVQIGDHVNVSADTHHFDYQVVSSTAVPRTDSSVLEPTSVPSVSLITCTGIWVPTIWDYTERLVVRAELVQ